MSLKRKVGQMHSLTRSLGLGYHTKHRQNRSRTSKMKYIGSWSQKWANSRMKSGKC